MDLLSLHLTLRPHKAEKSSTPPPLWWGRAAHALLLDVVRQSDDVLANRLHTGEDGLRPFTTSTLIGYSTRKGLQTSQVYRLRLTALTEELASLLWQAAGNDGPLAPGARVELDYLPFEIQSVMPAAGETGGSPEPPPLSDPWAGRTGYQELSAPYLLARLEAPRQVTLHFASPTTFKSSDIHQPIPLPELVFGSLLNRWNDYAPIVFPPEVKRYAAECLAISRYRLNSQVVPLKSGSKRIGGMGEVTYTSLNYDRYWMSLVHTLAEFALYAGVGASTSQGMGQCRRSDDRRGSVAG